MIEDCAQSHLAKWKGRVAGSFGKAAAYSFYPTKNLGALGDGGMLVTNDDAIAERATCLRNYGQSVRYYHPEIGMNSRLDEIHAAMLQVRLKWLPEFTQRRQAIAVQYLRGIDNKWVCQLAAPRETTAHVYHLYVVTCERRDSLQKHLESLGVQTQYHYPVAIHAKIFVTIHRDSEQASDTRRLVSRCLAIRR